MNSETKFLIKAISIVAIIFAALVWLLILSAKSNSRQNAEGYKGCISRTSDIPWCVEKFYSVTLPK